MVTNTLDRPQTRFDSFEIKTELAIHDHIYEDLSYPQDAHSIGIALERILLADFSAMNSSRKSYSFILTVNERSFLLSPKIFLGPTEVQSGSTKISSSIVVVITVSLYQGIAAYPDFKEGFALLKNDMVAFVSKLYENSTSPDREAPREFSVDLYFRDERDLLEEIRKEVNGKLR